MKKAAKILSVLIVLALSLAMIGCGGISTTQILNKSINCPVCNLHKCGILYHSTVAITPCEFIINRQEDRNEEEIQFYIAVRFFCNPAAVRPLCCC